MNRNQIENNGLVLNFQALIIEFQFSERVLSCLTTWVQNGSTYLIARKARGEKTANCFVSMLVNTYQHTQMYGKIGWGSREMYIFRTPKMISETKIDTPKNYAPLERACKM